MEDLLHLQLAEVLLFCAQESTKSSEVISFVSRALLREERKEKTHWLFHMFNSENLATPQMKAKFSMLKSIQNLCDVVVQPIIAVFCDRKAGVIIFIPE